MIQDNETNSLYVSALLKSTYPKFHKQFVEKMSDLGVEINYLQNTKDVWCRDYMPIQRGEKWFVQFKYEPDYLKEKEYDKIRTIPKDVWKEMGLNIIESDIVLDGGNVIKWKDKAIITDRILKDNPSVDTSALYDKIRFDLGVSQLTVIPEIIDEMTGHADGIVRFLDYDYLLINDFSKIDYDYSRKLKLSLLSAGYKFLVLPNNLESAKNNLDDRGDYLNFLEMKDFVLYPSYNKENDYLIERILKELFRDKKRVETIDCNDIAKEGGVLNCITWNIKK